MTRNSTCVVENIDIAAGKFGSASNTTFGSAYAVVAELVARIVVQGTYYPPAPACADICEYNLEFIAPALECTDTTNLVDFNTTLPFRSANSSDPVLTVWNSTYTWEAEGLVLLVAAAHMLLDSHGVFTPGSGQAVSCTAYNASYGMRVLHGMNTSVASLNSIQNYDRLLQVVASNVSADTVNQIMAQDALADAVAFQSDNSSFSPVTTSATRYHWVTHRLSSNSTRPVNLTSAIPAMMHNASISLFSGVLDVYGPTIRSPYNTTCLSYASFYHYHVWRLIVTYGVCIFGAAMCALLGSWTFLANGSRQSLGFARLLEATRNAPEASSGTIPPDTQLRMTNTGHFEFPDG